MNQINFRKERDLGATLEVASTFIKQHFVKILKPTLIVVVIPLLLGAFVLMSGMRDFYGNLDNMTDPAGAISFMTGMFSSYFLIMLAYIIAYIMFIGYMKLYEAGQEEITLNDLLDILKSNILKLTLGSILLIIVTYIGVFLCLLPGIYLSIVFTHFFAITIVEDAGFSQAWKRSFYLIKDNWWSCFGLYIVTYLISMAIMMLVYIPAYVIIGIDMFNSIQQNDPDAMINSMSSFSYILPFYYLAGLVMSLLFAVITTLRYYSLVEGKEGTGESEMIQKL